MGTLALFAFAPGGAGAQEAAPDAPTFERIAYLLDASGSMRARFGSGTKLDAARAMLAALDGRLAKDGRGPEPSLWAYGARSHRLERDCADVQLVARGERSELARGLAKLSPRGLSPIVAALENVLAGAAETSREVWVVFTDGADSCGRDPCDWAGRALALPGRPRIYVVGLNLEADDARALRCLTDRGSGYLLELRAGGAWQPQLDRLASVIRNRGTLRVEVRGPGRSGGAGQSGGQPADAELVGRIFRAGSTSALRTIRAGVPEELPGGMYRVVLETLPATVYDRVLVLPGEERLLTVEGLARLEVRAYSPANEPVAAVATLVAEEGAREELYVPGWRQVHVLAGTYRLTLEVGDSVALRGRLELQPDERRTVNAGGTGFVLARGPGVVNLAGVDVELQSYASGRTVKLYPWNEAVAVPAGEYRAVVRSLPLYVQEGFTVAPADTTALPLMDVGTLQVDVTDVDGHPLSVPVTLLRPGSAARAQELEDGAVVGTFLSGTRQAVLAGTYDLLLETTPSRVERGVRVPSGGERSLLVAAPASPPQPEGAREVLRPPPVSPASADPGRPEP